MPWLPAHALPRPIPQGLAPTHPNLRISVDVLDFGSDNGGPMSPKSPLRRASCRHSPEVPRQRNLGEHCFRLFYRYGASSSIEVGPPRGVEPSFSCFKKSARQALICTSIFRIPNISPQETCPERSTRRPVQYVPARLTGRKVVLPCSCLACRGRVAQPRDAHASDPPCCGSDVGELGFAQLWCGANCVRRRVRSLCLSCTRGKSASRYATGSILG